MTCIPNVDKELIIKAKQHDEQAIADIIEIIDKPCHKIALRYTFSNGLSNTDADDITQEAYLKVFQKLNSLEDENAFCAWLYVIVNNTAKDYLKRKEVVHKDTKFSEMDNDDFNEDFESTLRNEYTAFEPQQTSTTRFFKMVCGIVLISFPSMRKVRYISFISKT